MCIVGVIFGNAPRSPTMQSCPASSTSIKSPRGNSSATTRPVRQLHQMIRSASSSPSKKSDSAAYARRRRSHSVIVIQRLDRLNRKAFQKLFVQHGYFPARETFNSMRAYVHETFCEPRFFANHRRPKASISVARNESGCGRRNLKSNQSPETEPCLQYGPVT